MMRVPPLHQGEPVDAALLDAVIHEVTDMLPLSATALVAVIGSVLAGVPVLLIVLVARRRRSDAYHRQGGE